jgi:hypothetical protein
MLWKSVIMRKIEKGGDAGGDNRKTDRKKEKEREEKEEQVNLLNVFLDYVFKRLFMNKDLLKRFLFPFAGEGVATPSRGLGGDGVVVTPELMGQPLALFGGLYSPSLAKGNKNKGSRWNEIRKNK